MAKATIYKKEEYDQICFGGYMLFGFYFNPKIDKCSIVIDGREFYPGNDKIFQIGELRKGSRSSGFTEIKMVPPFFLQYAGKYQDYYLFSSSQTFPRDTYKAVFVALADISNEFFGFATASQAGRLIRKHFVTEIYEPVSKSQNSNNTNKMSKLIKNQRKEFYCTRCYGNFKSGKSKPKYCGKCKSSLWNTKRTYEVVGGELPVKKRTKLTGKAARNNSPEYVRHLEYLETLKLLEKAEKDYKIAVEQLNRDDWQSFDINFILYQLETFSQSIIETSFKYGELKEDDKTELYYYKRGVLISAKSNLDQEITRIDWMTRNGIFNDYDENSVNQYKALVDFETRRKETRDKIETEISNLLGKKEI